MRSKIVAIAFEVVANKISVVAVGDEADAFGKEWVVDLDLFEPYRALLSCNFGKTGDFVHQVALAYAPQGEGEFGAEGKSVKD